MEKEELDKIAKLRNCDKIIAALEAAGYAPIKEGDFANFPLSDARGKLAVKTNYYRKFCYVYTIAVFRNVPYREQFEYVLVERLKTNLKGMTLPNWAAFWVRKL